MKSKVVLSEIKEDLENMGYVIPFDISSGNIVNHEKEVIVYIASDGIEIRGVFSVLPAKHLRFIKICEGENKDMIKLIFGFNIYKFNVFFSK